MEKYNLGDFTIIINKEIGRASLFKKDKHIISLNSEVININMFIEFIFDTRLPRNKF